MSTERNANSKLGRAAGETPLDQLVFECLEQVERDGAPALDELCATHPELAVALRQRIAALSEAGLLGPTSAAERFDAVLRERLTAQPKPTRSLRGLVGALTVALACVAAFSWNEHARRVEVQARLDALRARMASAGASTDSTALRAALAALLVDEANPSR